MDKAGTLKGLAISLRSLVAISLRSLKYYLQAVCGGNSDAGQEHKT